MPSPPLVVVVSSVFWSRMCVHNRPTTTDPPFIRAVDSRTITVNLRRCDAKEMILRTGEFEFILFVFFMEIFQFNSILKNNKFKQNLWAGYLLVVLFCLLDLVSGQEEEWVVVIVREAIWPASSSWAVELGDSFTTIDSGGEEEEASLSRRRRRRSVYRVPGDLDDVKGAWTVLPLLPKCEP